MRRLWLIISVVTNLTILCIFKYYNFFLEQLIVMLSSLNVMIHPCFLKLALPVGISFYTFQTMSYSIDVFHGRLKASRSFVEFALFVAFFPQLVAGPIERAGRLLPQIRHTRVFSISQFQQGMFLIFWGLFQKVFVADNLALIVEEGIGKPDTVNGVGALIVLYAITIQVLCDFSGYSCIARGVSKSLGFELVINFKEPLFSQNPRELWNRWHISFSHWLRDYVYFPLGGGKKGVVRNYINLGITMGLAGLWHGAGINFIVFGLGHGLVIAAHRLYLDILNHFLPSRITKPKSFFKKGLHMFLMLHCFCFINIFYCVDALSDGISFLAKVVMMSDGAVPWSMLQSFASYTAVFFVVQVSQYRNDDRLAPLSWKKSVRVILYLVMFYSILLEGQLQGRDFVYFQF